MNQPHKHKDVIIAWANGAVIECRVTHTSSWHVVEDPNWSSGYEYRIKPEPEYPKTSFSGDDLLALGKKVDGSWVDVLVSTANTSIKQAIIDGDVIINPDKK